jgi:hypothetical protein
MHHPYSGETYTALPDGTVEVRNRYGDVGRVRVAEDGFSYTVVDGEVPRATLHLVKWAREIGVEEDATSDAASSAGSAQG